MNQILNFFPRTLYTFFFVAGITFASAQQQEKIPLNYPGAMAGIEWNTISGVTGVEYERILIVRDNITFGVKGTYIFKYKTGNMQLLSAPCCDISSIASGLATANIFTSRNRYPSGFFFQAGAGLGSKTREWEQGYKETRVRPAVEAGIGWLFPLGHGLAIKWTNTVTFPSKQAGITITRLAFGF